MNDLALDPRDDDPDAPAKKPDVALDVYVQTVQTFSGIVGRTLVLRRADKQFRTNGTVITVDPTHAVGYHVLEHEIAHILFKSDAAAREAFLALYLASVRSAFAKANTPFNEEGFLNFLRAIVGHLEDRRVNSLWGNLYPGSARLLREWMRKDMMKARGPAGLQRLLAEREVDLVRGTASEQERALGELFSAAYRMVDRRGFTATLIASRWLMTQLVTFFAAPPPSAQPQPQQGKGQGQQGQGQPGAQGEPSQGSAGDGQGEQEASGDAPATASGNGGSNGGGKQSPPLTAEQRMAALKALLDEAGRGSDAKPSAIQANDFDDTGLTSKATEAMANKVAQDVLRQAVEGAEEACEATSEAMQAIVDEVRDRLGLNHPVDHDDWLRKDLKAQVNFTDISKSEAQSMTLSPEQRLTVQRLRAHFMRVIGRQTIALEDSGTEVDVRAYIDRRVTGEALPFFKAETNGRGFEALIVLDRSGSMGGYHHNQVNLACQMLAEALNFPFVKLRVWGFNSPSNGVVKVSRFAQGTKGFDSEKSSSNGLTPLHVATQLGIRELLRGKGVRHLFMLTDGQPEFAALQGGAYSYVAMRDMTRKAVLQGKRVGVNTTGVILGNGVPDKQMNEMFVAERHWSRLVDPSLFCNDLFTLVLRNFGAYLRAR